MAHINNENNQMHVKRIKPEFSVDAAGNITWTPGLVDYNAKVFHRGKTVTNDEFNTLFLQDVYQGNYISDSLTELFNEHLHTAIYRTFTDTFNLIPSYIKYFAQPSDWGTLQEDGYYYLTVPASEHGFEPDETQGAVERMNIDTEMYVLNSDGKFYEVAQVTTGQDNTVTAYTDDNTIMGFLVIRTNDKSYALAGETIDATQVTGLADVAISGDYTDLINKPDNRILALENTLMLDPTDETTTISKKANDANNATNAVNLLSTGTIQNIPVSTIFETGVATVKNATNAVNLLSTGTIQNIPVSTIFETGVATVKNATNAVNATKAKFLDLKLEDYIVFDLAPTGGILRYTSAMLNPPGAYSILVNFRNYWFSFGLVYLSRTHAFDATHLVHRPPIPPSPSGFVLFDLYCTYWDSTQDEGLISLALYDSTGQKLTESFNEVQMYIRKIDV